MNQPKPSIDIQELMRVVSITVYKNFKYSIGRRPNVTNNDRIDTISVKSEQHVPQRVGGIGQTSTIGIELQQNNTRATKRALLISRRNLW